MFISKRASRKASSLLYLEKRIAFSHELYRFCGQYATIWACPQIKQRTARPENTRLKWAQEMAWGKALLFWKQITINQAVQSRKGFSNKSSIMKMSWGCRCRCVPPERRFKWRIVWSRYTAIRNGNSWRQRMLLKSWMYPEVQHTGLFGSSMMS